MSERRPIYFCLCLATAVASVAMAAPVPAVLPEGFADHAPTFRGANGSGRTDFDDVPTAWDESTGVNLLWKKPLALPGWASPVVWDDRVIAVGANPKERAVYCVDASTGDDIWTTKVPTHVNATTPYKTDTMDESWDALMYAGATPAVNGKQVFALFSNGQFVALDLASGKVLWNIAPTQTSTNKYGLDNSLLIYKDSVIVVFEGNERFIARYDAATGKPLWKVARRSPTWASPILATRADGSRLVVLPSDPDVTAWDPETGSQIWTTDVLTGGVDFCVGPSPVQVGDRVFVNCQNSGMYALNLADGSFAWKLEELPDGSGFPDGASMTTDGKYLYQFYESVLTCVDAASGAVVKQKELADYANYASALFNDGSLYLPCESMVLVLDANPDSGFVEQGQGVTEEICDSTPAVVAGRMYVRSDRSLYCFGMKPCSVASK